MWLSLRVQRFVCGDPSRRRQPFAEQTEGLTRSHDRWIERLRTELGAGLTAVLSVKLDRPEFEGATRDCLSNGLVRACVAEAVREHLTTWLRANPAQATAVLARISTTTRH